LWAVYDSVLDLKLTFFTKKAWFHLSGYISAGGIGAVLILRQTSEGTLHDLKIGVWCANTAILVAGPILDAF
jgi:hypothetical protein